MPRLNGTGPFGLGPQTGRGVGPCEKGRVRSPSVRDRWQRAVGRKNSAKIEIDELRKERDSLKDELREIEKRLSETEG